MIIVLEGPDCAGKTTLAKELCTRYDLAYHHEGPPPKDVHVFDYYMSVLESFDKKCVIDRFALGERVYGPILRQKDALGDVGWNLILLKFLMRQVIQIMCLPPHSECGPIFVKRQKEGKELLTLKQYIKSYEAWEKYAKNMFVYDYTQPHGKYLLFRMLDWRTRW